MENNSSLSLLTNIEDTSSYLFEILVQMFFSFLDNDPGENLMITSIIRRLMTLPPCVPNIKEFSSHLLFETLPHAIKQIVKKTGDI